MMWTCHAGMWPLTSFQWSTDFVKLSLVFMNRSVSPLPYNLRSSYLVHTLITEGTYTWLGPHFHGLLKKKSHPRFAEGAGKTYICFYTCWSYILIYEKYVQRHKCCKNTCHTSITSTLLSRQSPNKIIFVCKLHCIDWLETELCIDNWLDNPTYTMMTLT
jgi:hypothetical protein